MLNLALYSNQSSFFSEFGRELSSELKKHAKESFKIYKLPLFQTTFEDEEQKVFDLCLVDITEDPEGGLRFIRSLPRGLHTEIILIASEPEFAMQAYDADVMAYLLAPVDVPRVSRLILRRFTQRLGTDETQFSFKTARGIRVLPAERIVYVEYSDHRLIVYTDVGKKIFTTTMRTAFATASQQLLEDRRFVRTHASFIVNIMHISEFGQSVLQMDTGASVPVSHAKRREVKQQFMDFFSRS